MPGCWCLRWSTHTNTHVQNIQAAGIGHHQHSPHNSVASPHSVNFKTVLYFTPAHTSYSFAKISTMSSACSTPRTHWTTFSVRLHFSTYLMSILCPKYSNNYMWIHYNYGLDESICIYMHCLVYGLCINWYTCQPASHQYLFLALPHHSFLIPIFLRCPPEVNCMQICKFPPKTNTYGTAWQILHCITSATHSLVFTVCETVPRSWPIMPSILRVCVCVCSSNVEQVWVWWMCVCVCVCGRNRRRFCFKHIDGPVISPLYAGGGMR